MASSAHDDPVDRHRRRVERVQRIFRPDGIDARADWPPWRQQLNGIIFGADTPAGRRFDWAVLICIIVSVLAVMLESVASLRAEYRLFFRVLEWVVTITFTVEYVLRIITVRRPLGYALSFFGIVDLLAVIPTYLSLVVAGAQALIVVRVLRVLRVFRLLRLSQFVAESETLASALIAGSRKIVVFLGTVVTLVIIMGASMYLIEGASSGFDSIPRSVYWAIVTLTTVGYGDIAPQTPLGQAVAAAVMILGYSIIAVPTGIVTVELATANRASAAGLGRRACPACDLRGHDEDARFCKRCGTFLGMQK